LKNFCGKGQEKDALPTEVAIQQTFFSAWSLWAAWRPATLPWSALHKL